MSEKKYKYVYQTKNLINNKTYIGVHFTNDLNDGYIGCGIYRQPPESKRKCLFQKAVAKYGYENFKKEILSFFETEEETYEEESWLVDEKWVMSKDNYNIALGGKGGWGHVNNNKEKFIKRGELNPMYGRTGDKNPFFGKKHSQKTKDTLSKKHTGKKVSLETRLRMSESSPRLSGEDHPMFGKSHTEDNKRKASERSIKLHTDPNKKSEIIKGFKNVRKVKNIITGKEFVSMKDASKECNMEYREFIKLLKEGKLSNYKII